MLPQASIYLKQIPHEQLDKFVNENLGQLKETSRLHLIMPSLSV